MLDVALDLGALLPGNREDPVQVVAHHRGFRRHRAHGAQFLQLRQGFFAGFLGQLGRLDALFQLGQFVAAVLALAQLLLDRLQLLIEVILALGLLHLALHAVADALFNLQHADLAFHEGIDLFQAVADGPALQQFLLFGNLQRQVRGHGIGQLAEVVDLIDRDQHFRRDLLVQFDVLLELGDDGPRQGIEFPVVAGIVLDRLGIGLEEVLGVGVLADPCPLAAFDKHLNGPVRQLQQLQHRPDGADGIDIRRCRIVLRRVLLRDQKDLLVVLHDVLEGANRLIAANEERHNHVRKDDDVAQGQHREKVTASKFQHITSCKTGGRTTVCRRKSPTALGETPQVTLICFKNCRFSTGLQGPPSGGKNGGCKTSA